MLRGLALTGLTCVCLLAQHRQVAITIDDLPRGGDGPCEAGVVEDLTRRLLRPFREHRIPVIGFVNEGNCSIGDDALRRVLSLWLDAGGTLGNHTAHHTSLNKAATAEFEKDLLAGERITRPLLRKHNQELQYFRHPFLHVGLTLEKRKEAEKMLASHGYVVAPVTVDNSDYLFAAAYANAQRRGDEEVAGRVLAEYVPYMESLFDFFEKRTVEVIGRDIPQILLLHANELNARAMPDLLAMMKRRGYTFASLSQALEDEAYSQPDTYAGPGGFSWIHHWSKTKAMPGKGEPEAPAWLVEETRRSGGR